MKILPKLVSHTTIFILSLSLCFIACEKGGAIKAPIEKFYTMLISPDKQVNEADIKRILSESLLERISGLADRESLNLNNSIILSGFSSANDLPEGYEINAFMKANNQARMKVSFYQVSNGDTSRWTDNLQLVQESGAWKIDNIVYGKDGRYKDFASRIGS